jgi:hypothetical protein
VAGAGRCRARAWREGWQLSESAASSPRNSRIGVGSAGSRISSRRAAPCLQGQETFGVCLEFSRCGWGGVSRVMRQTKAGSARCGLFQAPFDPAQRAGVADAPRAGASSSPGRYWVRLRQGSCCTDTRARGRQSWRRCLQSARKPYRPWSPSLPCITIVCMIRNVGGCRMLRVLCVSRTSTSKPLLRFA